MHAVILWTVVGLNLTLALIGVVLTLLDRTADRLLLGAAAAAEAAVVVQSLAAGAGLLTGRPPVGSVPTFVAYLVGIAAIVPVAVLWAWADRNRWNGVTVAVGGLAVAVMSARLLMMWEGRA